MKSNFLLDVKLGPPILSPLAGVRAFSVMELGVKLMGLLGSGVIDSEMLMVLILGATFSSSTCRADEPEEPCELLL